MMESQQIYSVADSDFIENEEFDFDLPVSPVLLPTEVADDKDSPEEEDEDEVFFGPVGFKEQCVAKKTELSDSTEQCKPMSPLTTEQQVEIFKEATKVALLLKKNTDDETLFKEETNDDEPVNQLTVSISELALKPSNDNTTPNKSEMQQFKRVVKKDMRSPRRTTYTIAVSPAGQMPPPHLPTAEECVSSLVKNKPAEIKFTAKKFPEDNLEKPVAAKTKTAALKKSKLPAKRSGIPKTSGLRKPKAVLQKIDATKQSPPKRTRLASGESIEGLVPPSSPAHSVSDLNENNLVCSGKRRLPGSNNPVQNGLCKPAKHVTNGQRSTTSNAVLNDNGSSKHPASKLSLMKPGVIPRKTLAAARPSKLAKGTLSNKTIKLQPMKATLPLNPKNVAAIKPLSKATSKMQTPCKTPVIENKNVVPKRLLSSGSLSTTNKTTPRTSRASSVDSAIKANDNNNQHAKTPVQKKPSVAGTPQRSSQKVGNSVTGSSRRRSCIPTPMRSSFSSTSRLSSTSSVKSHHSPRTLPLHGPKTRIPSPIETPPPPKISPALPIETARQDNIGASPELAPVPAQKMLVNGRAALSEIQQKYIPSPHIDLLIKLDTPSPMQKNEVGSLLDLDDSGALNKKCLTPITMNSVKENLIDFL